MAVSPEKELAEWRDKSYRQAALIRRLSCEGDLLKTAIATIAGQKLPKEMSNPEDSDYEYAYEEIIKVARIASDAVQVPVSLGLAPE